MSRRSFASSWWGRAWVEALEGRARLDPNRLPRGRTYARQARVENLAVAAGSVSARVHGSRSRPYRVTVRVRRFENKEWDAALDAISARAAHAAALLDGELDPGIVDDLDAVGIEVLPGPGELGPSCSCPDWADPCKHSAAVCYLVATLLDNDPFVLLQLRGRDRESVLAGLRSRRARVAERSGQAGSPRHRREDDEGIPAREAFADAEGSDTATAYPAAPLPPARPHEPAPPLVELPASLGATSDLLELSHDAAQRAWELATGTGDGGLGLDSREDLARRSAVALAARTSVDHLAKHSGLPRRRLVSLGIAWERGGADGIAVLDDKWDAPPDDLAEARAALLAGAPAGSRVRASRNRVGRSDGIQLRFGRDQRWYLFQRRGQSWDLVGAPHVAPRQALQNGSDDAGQATAEQARKAGRPGG